MPKAADVDWGKIQEERNAGATTVALAEKYGVSTPTICAHTRPAKKQKSLPPPPARRGPQRQRGGFDGEKAGGVNEALRILRAEHDQIGHAIAALEEIGK